MSLWAVKDADGWFWDFTDEGFYEENDTRTAGIPNRDYANQIAKEHNGTLTEYVQKSAPIVVSQEEAEMLERAKSGHLWATNVIQNYIDMHMDGMSNDEKQQFEDRLMRAYVIGYTVAKETLYNVKVPHSTDGYYWRGISGQVHTYTEPDQHAHVLKTEAYVWAQEQINDAGLQGCEKVEVTDDEND
jgi:hypothetical protein